MKNVMGNKKFFVTLMMSSFCLSGCGGGGEGAAVQATGTQIVNITNATQVLPFGYERTVDVNVASTSAVAAASVGLTWSHRVIAGGAFATITKTTNSLIIKNSNVTTQDEKVQIQILVNGNVVENMTITLLSDKPYTYVLNSTGNYFLIVDPLHSASREESLKQSLYLAVASRLLQPTPPASLETAVRDRITILGYTDFPDFDSRASRFEKHGVVEFLYTQAGLDITDVANIPTFAGRYGLPYKQLGLTGVPRVISAVEVSSPGITVATTHDDPDPAFVMGDMGGKFVLVQSKNNSGNILREVVDHYLSSGGPVIPGRIPGIPGPGGGPVISGGIPVPPSLGGIPVPPGLGGVRATTPVDLIDSTRLTELEGQIVTGNEINLNKLLQYTFRAQLKVSYETGTARLPMLLASDKLNTFNGKLNSGSEFKNRFFLDKLVDAYMYLYKELPNLPKVVSKGRADGTQLSEFYGVVNMLINTYKQFRDDLARRITTLGAVGSYLEFYDDLALTGSEKDYIIKEIAKKLAATKRASPSLLGVSFEMSSNLGGGTLDEKMTTFIANLASFDLVAALERERLRREAADRAAALRLAETDRMKDVIRDFMRIHLLDEINSGAVRIIWTNLVNNKIDGSDGNMLALQARNLDPARPRNWDAHFSFLLSVLHGPNRVGPSDGEKGRKLCQLRSSLNNTSGFYALVNTACDEFIRDQNTVSSNNIGTSGVLTFSRTIL